MGVGIILPYIMAILLNGFVGSKFLKPDVKIMVESRFIIIDKDRSSNMHRIDKSQPFSNTTVSQSFFNLGGDIDEGPP